MLDEPGQKRAIQRASGGVGRLVHDHRLRGAWIHPGTGALFTFGAGILFMFRAGVSFTLIRAGTLSLSSRAGALFMFVLGGSLVTSRILGLKFMARVGVLYTRRLGGSYTWQTMGVLYKGCQAMLVGLYIITCYGGPGYVQGRGLAKDVDEEVGGSYPDETCGWLAGPAQSDLLSS